MSTTTYYIAITLGIVITLIGYFSRPSEIGWFILGFGTAVMIIGILLLIVNNFPFTKDKTTDSN